MEAKHHPPLLRHYRNNSRRRHPGLGHGSRAPWLSTPPALPQRWLPLKTSNLNTSCGWKRGSWYLVSYRIQRRMPCCQENGKSGSGNSKTNTPCALESYHFPEIPVKAQQKSGNFDDPRKLGPQWPHKVTHPKQVPLVHD
jgi:hypothetical protein